MPSPIAVAQTNRIARRANRPEAKLEKQRQYCLIICGLLKQVVVNRLAQLYGLQSQSDLIWNEDK
jgi:hypothetical protein